MKKKTMRNPYGIEVKICCASCEHRIVDCEGERTCQLVEVIVQQKFRCSLWQISYGMSKAGSGGGVVRHIVTKKVIIK